jgi:hypothetical protein
MPATRILAHLDFALERALVNVSTNAVIHFDDRGQGALAEAGDRAHGELFVGRRQDDLVGVASSFAVDTAENPARHEHFTGNCANHRVIGSAASNADGVLALWLQVKERVKGSNAVDAGQRRSRFRSNIEEMSRARGARCDASHSGMGV